MTQQEYEQKLDAALEELNRTWMGRKEGKAS